jgi:hypothetical protein
MRIDGELDKVPQAVGELTHHRFRFYPNAWSTFDAVEPCTKPEFCMGCTYKHPRCDSSGRVPKEEVNP